jgi:CopG family nickel-responsive transcriptional regulator
MSFVDRFTVSLDTELLAAFDRHIANRGYSNRSEAIRDLIRDLLVDTQLQEGDHPAVGVLVATCDQREPDTHKPLYTILSKDPSLYNGAFHIPADEDRELVAISLKGPIGRLRGLANQLQSRRGITHVHLSAVPLAD